MNISKRRSTGAMLTMLLSAAAAAAPPSPGLNVGEWKFDCKDGTLVGVQVVLRIPGEVLLPIPADICSQAFHARSAAGIKPLAVITPLGMPPGAAASAPKPKKKPM